MAYANYDQALNTAQTNLATAPGRTAAGTVLVGSQANVEANKVGALQQQRSVDPWGYYRGAAADQLAGQVGQPDPTDIYKSKLASLSNGQFSTDDPSYNWRFQQGQQAVERSQASKGLLNSGNAAIELQNYGQGAASQEFQAQYQRTLQSMAGVSDEYNQSQNRLMQLAGVGNTRDYLQKQQQDQASADNANYQMGLASGSQRRTNPLAGYSFG